MSRKAPPFLPWAAYLLALATLEVSFGGFFSLSRGLGHDHANAFPQLLDGYYWFLNNGLGSPPWFSPAFCAGIPLFADPQSFYYSPLQFFSFFTNPLSATHLTLLTYSSLGYLGMYLLCRQRLQASIPSSAFVALLWMLNGFITHRMIVGHVGFVGISLIPMISYLLLSVSIHRPIRILSILATGFLLASWVHSGLGTLLIAAALSVWGVLGIAIMRGAPSHTIYLNAIGAAILSLGLSASKLMAAISTMSNLERTMYPLPGFASIYDLLLASFSTLMLPSAWAQPIAWPLVKNAKIFLDVHEWTLNITPIPFVLIVAALFMRLLQRRKQVPSRPRITSAVHGLILLLILLFPLAVQFYTPDWNEILKNTPILKSISTPTRWLVLWLPLICVGAALALDFLSKIAASPDRWRITGGITLSCAICLLVYSEPRAFYENQNYDPTPILEAYARAQEPGFTPRVDKLGAYIDENGAVAYPMNRNDLITRGLSQAFCANPLFGYWLETFPSRDLSPGPMLRTLPSGHLNIKNPACYTFPTENSCQPGDHFRPEQLQAATRFTQYLPWDFGRSIQQRVCDKISQISLLVSLLLLLAYLAQLLHTRYRKHYNKPLN